MRLTKLKIGLLLDSYSVQAWIYQAIKRVIDSDYAEISLIILPAYLENSSKPNTIITLSQLMESIDSRLFVSTNNAVDQKNLESILTGIKTLEIRRDQDSDSNSLREEDIEHIRRAKIDILVNFSHQVYAERFIPLSTYGVWQFAFGDHASTSGEFVGYGEVIQNKPLTTAEVISLGLGAKPRRTLVRSNLSTYKYSPARNRNNIYWFASTFLSRQIELLARQGEDKFIEVTSRYNDPLPPLTVAGDDKPTGWAVLAGSLRLLGRIVRELFMRAFFVDTWYLMYGFNQQLTQQFTNEVAKFNKIMPPTDRFWADPHIVQRGDNYYAFIEEYIFNKRKAHISVIEIDSERNAKGPVPVLTEKYHLSYPFVFELDGTYYLIPESSAHKTVDLYCCEEFPAKWKFMMTLLEGVHAVDTTVVFFMGKWWLFTGINENSNVFPDVELFAYYSDTLFSTHWTPHPLNPIVTGATNSRPAGRIFLHNDKLYRPSQNCSKIYGFGFNVNAITELSETEYSEKMVFTIQPDWEHRVLATHTYNEAGQLTVIDAFERRPRLFLR